MAVHDFRYFISDWVQYEMTEKIWENIMGLRKLTHWSLEDFSEVLNE